MERLEEVQSDLLQQLREGAAGFRARNVEGLSWEYCWVEAGTGGFGNNIRSDKAAISISQQKWLNMWIEYLLDLAVSVLRMKA